MCQVYICEKVFTIVLPEEGNASYHYRMDMEEKERELADARNAALEEAAKACEELFALDNANAPLACAIQAIRALKTL